MLHDHTFSRAVPGFTGVDPAAPDASPAAGDPFATPLAAGESVPLFTLPPLHTLRDLACAAAANPLPAPADPTAPGEPGGASPALLDLLTLRADQVHRHGHTAAADDDQDLYQFARAADRPYARMRENASLHRVQGTRDAALKLAAIALAIAESCDRRLAALQEPGA